jgi:hypothetical protein
MIALFDFVLSLELIQEMIDEFFLHIVFHKDVVYTYTSLPSILEFAVKALHCCVIKVGGLIDYEGTFATQFEDAGYKILGCCLSD